MITGYSSEKASESQMFFSLDEERVVLKSEILAIVNQTPTVELMDITHCGNNSRAIITRNLFKGNHKEGLFAYHIFYLAKISHLDSLEGQRILTPTKGLQRFRATTTGGGGTIFQFDILDPCNQQFLTLFKDQKGYYYVKPPGHQRLLNTGISCVAVSLPGGGGSSTNDITINNPTNSGAYNNHYNNERELTLLELRNNSNTSWLLRKPLQEFSQMSL